MRYSLHLPLQALAPHDGNSCQRGHRTGNARGCDFSHPGKSVPLETDASRPTVSLRRKSTAVLCRAPLHKRCFLQLECRRSRIRRLRQQDRRNAPRRCADAHEQGGEEKTHDDAERSGNRHPVDHHGGFRRHLPCLVPHRTPPDEELVPLLLFLRRFRRVSEPDRRRSLRHRPPRGPRVPGPLRRLRLPARQHRHRHPKGGRASEHPSARPPRRARPRRALRLAGLDVPVRADDRHVAVLPAVRAVVLVLLQPHHDDLLLGLLLRPAAPPSLRLHHHPRRGTDGDAAHATAPWPGRQGDPGLETAGVPGPDRLLGRAGTGRDHLRSGGAAPLSRLPGRSGGGASPSRTARPPPIRTSSSPRGSSTGSSRATPIAALS